MPETPVHPDSFETMATLAVGNDEFRYWSLPALERRGVAEVSRLPYCLRILLENLLRHEDGKTVTAGDIEALARWRHDASNDRDIAFRPARVLLQDFTGVPVLVDLAALRDAAVALGGDPKRVNPLIPVDLVIDHSVQVDCSGAPDAAERNARMEYERNRERYSFMRWGQKVFANLRVVPPSTGICHQVNLEHLATVVVRGEEGGVVTAFPDTVIGTDSHTTMVNSLGVAGWGVGGIEAEAAMLGEPVSLSIPAVVGVRLIGRLPDGATAHDAVLTITQKLRRHGVVGKFVEFFGDGASALSVPDRSTISNMAPEYGATMGYFPVDEATLDYLELTGRPAEGIALVREWFKAQGLFRTRASHDPHYSEVVMVDLAQVEPCVAGPRRPQDRVPLGEVRQVFQRALGAAAAEGGFGVPAQEAGREMPVHVAGRDTTVRHGSVVIASITSCTSTSNPSALIAAGLLARNALGAGLAVPPSVKTSFSPGSRVAVDWLESAGLMHPLEGLGFHVTGYGCMTCIGNSGPLAEPVAEAVQKGKLVAAAVLSGNRNFEGRINPLARASWLASPPLVVAYALAGTVDIDLTREPLGRGTGGREILLSEIWPEERDIREALERSVHPGLFKKRYADAFKGDTHWQALPSPTGERFPWEPTSTYIRCSPFLEHACREPRPLSDIIGSRVLVMLGDSVTTDHISPAGSIAAASPAGEHLARQGFSPADFNSYGSRRGNHRVMVRGTFANIRLRNQLAPGTEGGVTLHLPGGKPMTVFEASETYRKEGVPLIVLAGREYGTGSSRDWAAKGPALLGVRAVIAQSFERIHRSNLVQMGILPLEFPAGQGRESLGLTGREAYDITGISAGVAPRAKVSVVARIDGGKTIAFIATARIDTKAESEYFRHGGILPYVLRRIAH